MKLLPALLLSSMLPVIAAQPQKNVKYDTKHERNVLDFWPALQQDKPAPVMVWFHGGGFRNGDKSSIERRGAATLRAYRDAGYAVVSCNYPFLGKAMGYEDIVEHCARAVQFIRSRSKEWNINPEHLCCGGVSAGALISQFLGYHDDFANPRDSDPVAHQSSKPAIVLGIMQPIGTYEFAIRFMEKGEAPLFLYSDAKLSDKIHPPKQALFIAQKAKELGIPHALYGGGNNELPKIPGEKSWQELHLAFCSKNFPKKN